MCIFQEKLRNFDFWTFKWSSVRHPPLPGTLSFSFKPKYETTVCLHRHRELPEGLNSNIILSISCFLGVYLALCDFAGGFLEEGGPGREKVLFGVLFQAAVATAHRAIPRHLRGTLLDSNSAASKPPKTERMLGRNELQEHARYRGVGSCVTAGLAVCPGRTSSFQSAQPSPVNSTGTSKTHWEVSIFNKKV